MGALNPGILHEMVERLAREFDPEAIILFGSHAWGDPGEDSDVDLLVVVSGSSSCGLPAKKAGHEKKATPMKRLPTKTKGSAALFVLDYPSWIPQPSNAWYRIETMDPF